MYVCNGEARKIVPAVVPSGNNVQNN